MRLLVLSDLHREFWTKHQVSFDLAASVPDLVVLAGDIDTSGERAVEWAARTFQDLPIVYVHGNHEGYGRNLDSELEKIKARCTAAGNVRFLDCEEYHQSGVRFLGAALWTDFNLFGHDKQTAAMTHSEAVLSDYRRIRLASKGYRKLRAADTALLCESHRTWLENMLSVPHPGPTVVVTHMAPSFRSVSPKYSVDLASSAYASNFDYLAAKADIWVHGHMHESLDYKIGQCRVICNPFGYMSKDGRAENAQFSSELIVDVPT